jgi:hypothetical protein
MRHSITPKRMYARTSIELSRGSRDGMGDRQERSVSEDEYDSMPERISNHFDRVRDLLSEATDDSDT